MKAIKSVLCVLLAAVLLAGCLPAAAAAQETPAQTPGRLIVNGKPVETDDVALYLDSAQQLQFFTVPLTSVMRALGGRLIWIGETRALLFYKGFVFRLDTAAGTASLFPIGGDYFSLVGGGPPHPFIRERRGDEFVVDDSAAQSLFELLEVSLSCDPAQSLVTVKAKGRYPALDFGAQLCMLGALVVFGVPLVLFELLQERLTPALVFG